jgi:hypothetical protein
LLQHRRRQGGKGGSVSRGVQFGVNLRRPAVIDQELNNEPPPLASDRSCVIA